VDRVPAKTGPGLHARIHAVVKRIPRGRVASYGQIARIAGLASHARLVGYAMAALPDDSRVPWQRVVNAQGRVSLRSSPGFDSLQRVLLEREGVRFDASGRIDLAHFGWQPRAAPSAARSRTRQGSRARRC
jgi:methylated-DNA-protein-cysteine methyltransferase-like protein